MTSTCIATLKELKTFLKDNPDYTGTIAVLHSLIQPSPLNPRQAFLSIDNLAASLLKDGQLQNLTVRAAGTTAKPFLEIAAGERRWRAIDHLLKGPEEAAAKERGLHLVLVAIRKLTDLDMLRIMITENDSDIRNDLTPMEEALGFSRMEEHGLAKGAIAQEINRAPAYVTRRLSLLTLSHEAQVAVNEGKLAINTAYELSRIDPTKQPLALEMLLQPDWQGNYMPRDRAIEALHREFLEPAEKAAKWAKRQAQIQKQYPGAEVLDYEASLEARHGNTIASLDSPCFDTSPAYHARHPKNPWPQWREFFIASEVPLVIYCDHELNPVEAAKKALIIAAQGKLHTETPEKCPFPMQGKAGADQKHADAQARKKEQIHEEALAQGRKTFLTYLDAAVRKAPRNPPSFNELHRFFIEDSCDSLYRLEKWTGVKLVAPREFDEDPDWDLTAWPGIGTESGLHSLIVCAGVADTITVSNPLRNPGIAKICEDYGFTDWREVASRFWDETAPSAE